MLAKLLKSVLNGRYDMHFSYDTTEAKKERQDYTAQRKSSRSMTRLTEELYSQHWGLSSSDCYI